ncbi:hypothetical protein NQ318_012706 [Aromia moschata]|uniref:CRAL/TRIO N-terminal domain-containing protein n=1 Tax=Aromia moschata TaxID=1265417 RepID=A0AAV8Y205_9CUCU|nr:hypothetical protein NQ318_012706 [Aromia moschata]
MIVFFDIRVGIAYGHWVPEGQTVNQHYYIEVLTALRERVRRQRPDLWKTKSRKIHQDNAPAHSALSVFFLQNTALLCWNVQHTHLTDRGQPLGLFISQALKGTRFESVEAVKAKATEVLNQLTEADFQNCFQQWKSHIERCRDRQGEYIEGEIVLLGSGSQKQIANFTLKDTIVPRHCLEATKEFLEKVNAKYRRKIGPVAWSMAVRFLYARKFDVVRALVLFDQHEMTRQREGLCRFDPLQEPLQSELLTGKFTILPKRDSTDAAIAVFTAHKHIPANSTHQTTLQGVVYQLDCALQNPVTQKAGIVFIYDMSNSKYSNFDYDLSQKILTLLKSVVRRARRLHDSNRHYCPASKYPVIYPCGFYQ